MKDLWKKKERGGFLFHSHSSHLLPMSKGKIQMTGFTRAVCIQQCHIPPSASSRSPGLKISDKTIAFANPLPASLSAPHKGNRHEKPWHKKPRHKSIIHTSAIIH